MKHDYWTNESERQSQRDKERGFEFMNKTPFVTIKEPGEMNKIIDSNVAKEVLRVGGVQAYELGLMISRTFIDFQSFAAGRLGKTIKEIKELDNE